MHVANSKEPTTKLLELTNERSKVRGCEVNTQNSVVSLCTY